METIGDPEHQGLHAIEGDYLYTTLLKSRNLADFLKSSSFPSRWTSRQLPISAIYGIKPPNA
jgi:hypothetical protein